MIFDDIERVDSEPAMRSDSEIGYLNRSARPEAARVRALLESWFERYPAEHANELRSRLRSHDDRQFHGAFFELYLHELMLVQGYEVTVHPEAPDGGGRRPDFLVRTASGAEFYLESIVATGRSAAEYGAAARLNEAYDALNRLESPDFSVGLRIGQAPEKPVPGREFRHFVREFIKDLDPDECERLLAEGGLSALPHTTYTHEGWEIGVFALPKKAGDRGTSSARPVGMYFHEVRRIDPRSDIRNAIVKKATRYGGHTVPYVVAVNAIDAHIGFSDVMEGLFGKENYTFLVSQDGEVADGQPKMNRAADGAWHGPGGPQNTRVSAVLVTSDVAPWTVADRTPTVYHNPWAQHSALKVLVNLETATPVDGEMRMRPGPNGAALFKLPDLWPLEPSA